MKLSELSYIFFDDEDGAKLVGFNRFNTSGFIDDGSGWTQDDRFELDDMLESLRDFVHVYPSNILTHAVFNEAELENKLNELGLK